MAPIESYISHEPNTGCWLWNGSLDSKGYAQKRLNGKSHLAHRLTWASLNGAIPHDSELSHTCKIKLCVNPGHLRLVPRGMSALGTSQYGATSYDRKVYYRARRQSLLARDDGFINHERSNNRKNYLRNRSSIKISKRAYSAKLKLDMVAAYGGRCSCCGEDEIKFLTLEHTRGDGKTHRKLHGSGVGCWADLRKRGWPKDGYTIFCLNCNMASAGGKPCPHLTKLAMII